MLVLRGAGNRGERGGRDQPAERIASLGALGHVTRGDLEDMKHAVEIGREHAAPFLFGAIDERLSATAADAGIGEAAVDAAEFLQRRGERCLDLRGGRRRRRLACRPCRPSLLMTSAACAFFSALRPHSDTAQPCDASPCAMPRPMPPLPPVMTATRPLRSNRFMALLPDSSRAIAPQLCGHHGEKRLRNQISRARLI